jgi:ATP-dependent DNA helicase RecG
MNMDLDTPVQFLKGVGPKISSLLAKKDIHKVGDALQWFPRTYEDRKSATSIKDLAPGQLASFVGRVSVYREIPMGKSVRRIHEIIFKDDTGRISAKWLFCEF